MVIELLGKVAGRWGVDARTLRLALAVGGLLGWAGVAAHLPALMKTLQTLLAVAIAVLWAAGIPWRVTGSNGLRHW